MSVNLSFSVSVSVWVSLCVRACVMMIHRADCPGDVIIIVRNVVVALN